MIYRFADVELSSDLFQIRRGSEVVRLTPRVYSVLMYLLRHRERVVTKRELLDEVWGETFVNEASLPQCITQIRRALRQTRDSEPVIQTLYGRGYRFVAPVVEQRADGPPPVPEPHEPSEVPLDRLFIGRADELGELREALDAAASARGRAVFLVGEPGIGKTRLAEHFAVFAGLRGIPVLWGRCHEEEGAPPYWPWIQILTAHLKDRDTAELRSHLGSAAPEIAELLPFVRESLGLPPRTVEAEPAQARFRLYQSVVALLERAGRQKAIVLVLEDLHWADRESLALLKFLAPELEGTRLLLVGTYREEESDARALATAEFARQQRSAWVHLAGLTRSEVGAFIEQAAYVAPPARLVDAVYEQTQGNPFFVDEVVSLLATEGVLEDDDAMSAWTPGIPQGVKEVVARRLLRLSDACNRLLRAGAVAGREFDLFVVQQVVGMEDEPLLEAIEEAAEAGVVREIPETIDRYAFTHALLHDSVYGGLNASRRVRLHLRMGEALEERYAENLEDHLAELARHFLAALPTGDVDRAIDYAIRAAQGAVAVLAPESAALHYEGGLHALEQARELDERRRCELLIAIANVRHPNDEAIAEAIALARKLDDAELFARAVLARSPSVLDPARPSADFEEALERLGGGDGEIQVSLLAQISQANAGTLGCRGPEFGRRALEMARRLGDTDRVLHALERQVSFSPPHRLAERIAEMEEMTRICAQEGVWSHALCQEFGLAIEVGDVARASEVLAANLARPEARQIPFVQHELTHQRGQLAILEGRFSEAEDLARENFAYGRRFDHFLAHPRLLVALADIRGLQGGLGEFLAGEYRELTASSAAPTDGPEPSFAQQSAFQVAFALLGLAEPTRAWFSAIGEKELADMALDYTWSDTAARLAYICWFLRDAERAAPLYEMILPFADHSPMAGLYASTGSFQLRLAFLAATLRRFGTAEDHFVASRERHERMGARPFAGLTLAHHGGMLIERGGRGDAARASELLDLAQEAADELEMTDLAARIAAYRARL